jgi:hypothetical protein
MMVIGSDQAPAASVVAWAIVRSLTASPLALTLRACRAIAA